MADIEIRKTMEDMEVLTVAKARTLIGKTIEWTYIGYRYNPQQYYRSTVGSIVTGEELARKEPMDGYESRWDYWVKKVPRALYEERNTLYLLDERGKKTYMVAHCNKYNFYPEPTFTCSDADREVYFRIV